MEGLPHGSWSWRSAGGARVCLGGQHLLISEGENKNIGENNEKKNSGDGKIMEKTSVKLGSVGMHCTSKVFG